MNPLLAMSIICKVWNLGYFYQSFCHQNPLDQSLYWCRSTQLQQVIPEKEYLPLQLIRNMKTIIKKTPKKFQKIK